MRRKLIAGNWKMNTSLRDALKLVSALKGLVRNVRKVDIVVCPPFTNIYAVNQLLKGSKIKLGAQDVFWEQKGAFTGEISASMLKSVGCSYVIIGHSERRRYFKETDADVSRKINAALSNGLKPIVCVGETLKERKAGKKRQVVERQLRNGLVSIPKENLSKVIIAYEPIWAISGGDPTHQAATPADGQEMHLFIRGVISKMYGRAAADKMIIIYGGSAKPSNAKEILSMPDIDGALVGGASLSAEEFAEVVKSV